MAKGLGALVVAAAAAADDIIGEVADVVDGLDDLWSACKEAGVRIDVVLDALDAGDTLAEVLAVLKTLGKRHAEKRPLPGAEQGHRAAFRFHRALRRRSRAPGAGSAGRSLDPAGLAPGE